MVVLTEQCVDWDDVQAAQMEEHCRFKLRDLDSPGQIFFQIEKLLRI